MKNRKTHVELLFVLVEVLCVHVMWHVLIVLDCLAHTHTFNRLSVGTMCESWIDRPGVDALISHRFGIIHIFYFYLLFVCAWPTTNIFNASLNWIVVNLDHIVIFVESINCAGWLLKITKIYRPAFCLANTSFDTDPIQSLETCNNKTMITIYITHFNLWSKLHKLKQMK